ncbi:MAG: hypothetical protein WBN83_16920 [Desulfoprunum sp.]
MPMAIPCSSGSKLSRRIAWDSGVIAPPPIPCRTRARISRSRLRARPQSTEETVNSNTETK